MVLPISDDYLLHFHWSKTILDLQYGTAFIWDKYNHLVSRLRLKKPNLTLCVTNSIPVSYYLTEIKYPKIDTSLVLFICIVLAEEHEYYNQCEITATKSSSNRS